MKGLTNRQKQVLDFIKQYVAEHKYPPTVREIGEYFGISAKAGHDHVKALQRKQYIRCHGNRSRAIEVLDHSGENEGTEPGRVHTVPMLGKVAAGRPLFAEENFEGLIRLPSGYLGNGRYFALKVAGDSMMNAGIIDGDVAIIRHQNDADNGDIVVALVDEEAVTLKRFFRKPNAIELRPENPEYHPIFSQSVRVLGRLACLVRQYERA